MAKVRGAFGGFGTTQQIGKAYVFFLWKGINCIRTWVIPNNPNTGDQQTERADFKSLITAWHDGLFNVGDIEAWERAAGTVKYRPQSGFNRFIGLYRSIFQTINTPNRLYGEVTSNTVKTTFTCLITPTSAPLSPGTKVLQWGTSPTSLWRTEALVYVSDLTAGPFDTGFGVGVKIYFRFSLYDNSFTPLLYSQSGIYSAVLT